MNGIVLELQSDALKADIDISTLLRKAFLVAKKLKLTDFEYWLNKEINGYRGDAEIPTYREVSGEVKGWNPYNGWIPTLIADNKWHKTLSNRFVPDSISSLVSLLQSDGNPNISFPGAASATISEMTGFQTKYTLFISKNSIDAIIETVRARILDWAILLEENGIIGEGLSFSDKEKEIASNTPQIVNYTNNFYKDADNIQIQQGSEKSKQSNKGTLHRKKD